MSLRFTYLQHSHGNTYSHEATSISRQ